MLGHRRKAGMQIPSRRRYLSHLPDQAKCVCRSGTWERPVSRGTGGRGATPAGMKYHLGETPANNGGARSRPDRDQWMDYAWPATRLTSDDMERLCILRAETKKPITQILHEAVELMYELFRNEGP